MSTAFTDTYVRNLKSVGRYTDIATQGLNLHVKAGGGKYWTFRYQYEGKRQDLSLGKVTQKVLHSPQIVVKIRGTA